MILVIIGLHIIVQFGHVRQHTKVGIVQNLIGMHPEDVRHGVGLGGRLQLGPILVPVRYLHLNDHIGVFLRVGIADGLHTLALGNVPDLEFEMGLAVHRTTAAQGHQQRHSQRKRRNSGDFFHKHHSSASLLQFFSAPPLRLRFHGNHTPSPVSL